MHSLFIVDKIVHIQNHIQVNIKLRWMIMWLCFRQLMSSGLDRRRQLGDIEFSNRYSEFLRSKAKHTSICAFLRRMQGIKKRCDMWPAHYKNSETYSNTNDGKTCDSIHSSPSNLTFLFLCIKIRQECSVQLFKDRSQIKVVNIEEMNK